MEWLKEAREKKGITQFQLAKEVGCTGNYIYLIECGKKRPSTDMAKKIAKILGCKWTKFYED